MSQSQPCDLHRACVSRPRRSTGDCTLDPAPQGCTPPLRTGQCARQVPTSLPPQPHRCTAPWLQCHADAVARALSTSRRDAGAIHAHKRCALSLQPGRLRACAPGAPRGARPAARAAARAHRNEVLRGRDRVRERVVLGHQPPALVPELAALAAAAHARNRMDDAALQ